MLPVLPVTFQELPQHGCVLCVLELLLEQRGSSLEQSPLEVGSWEPSLCAPLCVK